MTRFLISLLIVIMSSPLAFAEPLDHMSTDQRVETLFADARSANRSGDRLETMKALKLILRDLLHEEAESTMRASRYLRDSGRLIADLYRRVRGGEMIHSREIENLAVEVLETLAMHFKERASLRRQQKMYARESEDLLRSRAAGLAALRWSGKAGRESGQQGTVRALTSVGQESVKGVGRTFSTVSRGINRFFGIERYQRREELRPQPDPDPWE